MDDNDLMPFGKYKGKKIIDVPDEYLLWLYDRLHSGVLLDYIYDNLDSIRANIAYRNEETND